MWVLPISSAEAAPGSGRWQRTSAAPSVSVSKVGAGPTSGSPGPSRIAYPPLNSGGTTGTRPPSLCPGHAVCNDPTLPDVAGGGESRGEPDPELALRRAGRALRARAEWTDG